MTKGVSSGKFGSKRSVSSGKFGSKRNTEHGRAVSGRGRKKTVAAHMLAYGIGVHGYRNKVASKFGTKRNKERLRFIGTNRYAPARPARFWGFGVRGRGSNVVTYDPSKHTTSYAPASRDWPNVVHINNHYPPNLDSRTGGMIDNRLPALHEGEVNMNNSGVSAFTPVARGGLRGRDGRGSGDPKPKYSGSGGEKHKTYSNEAHVLGDHYGTQKVPSVSKTARKSYHLRGHDEL